MRGRVRFLGQMRRGGLRDEMEISMFCVAFVIRIVEQ